MVAIPGAPLRAAAAEAVRPNLKAKPLRIPRNRVAVAVAAVNNSIPNTMDALKKRIDGDKPVLIDFYADWCGPCKMMTPILEEFKQMVGDSIDILKIDVDRNMSAAIDYQVQSVPTLMFFRSGKLLWKNSGVVRAKELKQMTDRFLSL